MIGNITLDLIDDMGRVMRLPLAINPSADAITDPQDGDYIINPNEVKCVPIYHTSTWSIS